MTQTIDESRTISMTRVFRAPRELLLKVFSDPAHLTNWWGPHGFSIRTDSFEFQPGGWWIFTMCAPDGTEFPNRIRYIKTGPDRLELAHSVDGQTVDFHIEATLKELDGNRTELEWRLVFPTVEECRRIEEQYGARAGLVGTLTRLDVLLAEQLAESDPFKLHLAIASDTEILMYRSFHAPRKLVFKAMTTADMIRNWQAPHGYPFTECSFDAQVGGKWSMTQLDDKGGEHSFYGEVVELDAPRLLSTTFYYAPWPDAKIVNRIELEEKGGITKMRLLSTHLNKEDRDGMLNSGMEWGAGQSYDRLDELTRVG